jgi:cellulose biosynthesis protein BcsQ
MLSTHGFRVLLLDADAQCSLSTFLLAGQYGKKYREFIQRKGKVQTFFDQLNSYHLQDAKFANEAVPGETMSENLILIPGDNRLENIIPSITSDRLLYKAGLTSGGYTLDTAIHSYVQLNAQQAKADIVVVDTSPSANALNLHLLMGSDLWVIPAMEDCHSVNSFENMLSQLPGWIEERKAIYELNRRSEETAKGDKNETWWSKLMQFSSFPPKPPRIACLSLLQSLDPKSTREERNELIDLGSQMQKVLGYTGSPLVWDMPRFSIKPGHIPDFVDDTVRKKFVSLIRSVQKDF